MKTPQRKIPLEKCKTHMHTRALPQICERNNRSAGVDHRLRHSDRPASTSEFREAELMVWRVHGEAEEDGCFNFGALGVPSCMVQSTLKSWSPRRTQRLDTPARALAVAPTAMCLQQMPFQASFPLLVGWGQQPSHGLETRII